MVNKKEYKIQDISPNVIYECRFVDEDWESLVDMDYIFVETNGQTIDNKTDNKGLVIEPSLKTGVTIKLKLQKKNDQNGIDAEGEAVGYEDIVELEEEKSPEENPGPLPSLDLRNRSEGGQEPLKREDPRQSLIRHFQLMLNELGYDLGLTGPEEDGVDGLYQERSEEAVKEFQELHKDWDGQPLNVNGMVGPRTSDALNRELVGIWYEKYDTPDQLTPGRKLIAMTESFSAEEGLII